MTRWTAMTLGAALLAASGAWAQGPDDEARVQAQQEARERAQVGDPEAGVQERTQEQSSVRVQDQDRAQTQGGTAPADRGPGFVDADGDGICDRFQAGLPGRGGRGRGRGRGWGPGDGTGNAGVGPRDGTGYGAGSGMGAGPGSASCDGTGPKGQGPRGPRR